MPLITETYYLSLTQDNRGILRLRCSQDDTLRTVNLKLYNNGSIFTIPSGISAYVSGVKQNGAVFSKSCTISQDRKSVVLQLSSGITNVDGVIIAEIVLNDGEGGRLGTSNFIIQVEKNPIRAGVIQDTETPIEYINDFITQIQALTARVNNLITPNGDPSLAEVVDARISSLDGHTYQNLKARIDADIAILNTNKANKSEVYTKSQVDTLLENVEIDVDDELSDESENPVQNKVINREISEIKADLDSNGFSAEAKAALVACLQKVSWSNETDGTGLMNALEVALGITPSQRREELPAAYEQVTYIYGIAGQYINTGIKSQIPLEIQCEAGRGANSPNIGAYNASVANSRFFPFGFQQSDGNKIRIACRYANDTITIPGGSSGAQWLYSVNVETIAGEMYTVISGIKAATNSNNAVTYIDVDDTYVEVERAKPALGNDIMLFNIPVANTSSKLRLGYFKAYAGNTLLADYIPCYRKSDNVAGFYDVVSESFKVNQGTGSFEVGDVVK